MHALLLALLIPGRIDAAVQIVMRSQHVAGMSVGVEQHGRIVFARGYGQSDVLRHAGARPGTVYRIGSLTKMFTARAVGVLAERGKLGLDRPAIRYLPAFPWGDAVTVRDLLAQRSGVPSYTDGTPLNPYAWYAPAQLVGSVARLPLAFKPGTRFEYSNTNYVLLGMIVQRIAHVEYEDYVDGHVVAPLHLRATRYGDQPGEALGYKWDGGAFQRATASSPGYAFSAAAMTSNVPDLLRFLQTMRAPYYGLLQSEQFGEGVWYASGNVDGYSAFAFLLPQRDEAAVILCNADRVDLAPLAIDVLDAMHPTSAKTFGPPQNEDPKITDALRKRAAALFAPLEVRLLEFLGNETEAGSKIVLYRVTLSDGSRFELRAPVSPAGSVGEIQITAL